MKKGSLYILFLLLMCSCTGLYGQGHSVHLDIDDPQTRILWDSLIAYNDANQYYEAIPLLHRITQQAEKAGEVEALAFAYENLSELKYLKGEFDNSKRYLKKSASYFLKLENWNEYAHKLRRLSDIECVKSNYESAFDYLNKIRQVQHKLTDKKIKLNLYNDLGALFHQEGRFDSAYHYRKLLVDNTSDLDTIFANGGNLAMTSTLISVQDYEKAMRYAKRAMDFTNQNKYPLSFARTLGRIGYLEYIIGNHENANEDFAGTIEILKNTKHSEKLLFEFYPFFALNAIELGEYDQAKKMIAAAKPLLRKENSQLCFEFYIASLELALIDNDILESEKLFNKLKNLDGEPSLIQEVRFLKLSSRYFETIGNKESALLYFEKYSSIKDSLQSIQNVKTIQNLEIEFETEKKDTQITAASNRIRLQQNGLLIGGSLLLGLGALLFFNDKNKKRIAAQNKLISKTLSEKEILLKEIHHRVKNNLQVISSLLSIQSRSIDDEKAKDAIVESRTRVHSMSLIHQDLYKKDNLTGVRMDRYLGSLTKDLLDTYNVSEGVITLDNQIEPLKLDVDSVIPLGLIVNELMSNALKYAFPENRDGTIAVLLKEQGESLLLQVSDNGVGMKEDQVDANSDSFGHTLIRAFKSKLDAKIDIQSKEGTVVKLIINNYKKVV